MADNGIDEQVMNALRVHMDNWLNDRGGAYRDQTWVTKSAHKEKVMAEVNNFLQGMVAEPRDRERYQKQFAFERCGDDQVID